MKSPMTRRTFLAAAGCVGGGVALASRFSQSVFAGDKSPLWPVTCRDAILPPTRQSDCWSALQTVGAEGVEVQVAEDLTLPGLFHPTTKYTVATTAGIEQLAADAKAAGQRITAFCTFNRFEERPKVEIQWCTQVAQVAQALGVPAVRIDVVPTRLAQADFLKLAVAALKKVMANYAEYTCPIDRGDIDFARVVAILRKAGYHNDLCVEDESLGKLAGGDEVTKTLVNETRLLKRLRSQ